jgi:hypothetical protein
LFIFEQAQKVKSGPFNKDFLTQKIVNSSQQYGMRIPYLKKLIPNSGSRGQKKNIGPRIRFRNTAQDYDLPGENLSFLRIFQIFFLLLNMFAFFPDMIQTNHIGE